MPVRWGFLVLFFLGGKATGAFSLRLGQQRGARKKFVFLTSLLLEGNTDILKANQINR